MAADDQQGGQGRQLATSQPVNDFSTVLTRTIESVKNDPAQFRNLIYEMARVQLQKDAWHRNPPMNILELRRMMLALETAIERVETASSARDATPMLPPSDWAALPGDGVVMIDQPEEAQSHSAPA